MKIYAAQDRVIQKMFLNVYVQNAILHFIALRKILGYKKGHDVGLRVSPIMWTY
jgi:hypothetical protein